MALRGGASPRNAYYCLTTDLLFTAFCVLLSTCYCTDSFLRATTYYLLLTTYYLLLTTYYLLLYIYYSLFTTYFTQLLIPFCAPLPPAHCILLCTY